MSREGIVRDLAEHAYHRGPELSSTGMKTLLDCPARYHTPHAPKAAWDLGHVAHELILGAGQGLQVVDAPDWRTKAAQDAQKAARTAGRVPTLRADLLTATKVRRAVRRHPIAGSLFREGLAEVSLFWTDDETGVPLRARIDWLTVTDGGRDLIVDLKTARKGGADPHRFGRSAHEYGYHVQTATYLAGAVATGLVGPDAGFLHVIAETDAPHVVTVAQLDDNALALGHQQMREAIDIYRDCSLTGVWPTYTDDIAPVSLPRYAFSGAPF